MERKWFWKVGLIVVLLLFAAVASVTTFVPATQGESKDNWSTKLKGLFPGINLGLDLQGGLRLIYEVQVEDAIRDKRDRLAESLMTELAEKAELKDLKLDVTDDSSRFSLTFPSVGELEAKDTQDVLTNYRQVLNSESEAGAVLEFAIIEEEVDYTSEMAVKQAIETIGNRIDELGLLNTAVVPRGVDIIVEIPGVDENQINRIKRIISQTARLEFKIVDEVGSKKFFDSAVVKDKISADEWPIKIQREKVRAGEDGMVWSYYMEAKDEIKGRSGRQILKEFLGQVDLPAEASIGFQKIQALDDAGNPTADVTWRTFYMQRVAGVTGEYVEHASVRNDEQSGKPFVSLDFNQAGAKIFGDLTEKNVGRRMAIQLDDKVNSAPVIQEKIPGGSARITLGGFESYQQLAADAQDLVVVLRAGALPAPLKPVTESTVGPALGQDSIDMGSMALIIAFLSIIAFMLVYYRGGGIAADTALLANGVFIVGILSGVGATLTLPGIAGIILTIGMAVDANVIIYERIREELRAGKSPRAAVDAGYKRAFWTIFDAQITTFIAGVVMLQYGTGAIKGFAVTLLIGIVTSMFSAIVISRLVFDVMTKRRSEYLSI